MSSDDYARGSHYSSNRRPGGSGPKSHNYSPSSNYNYGNGNSHGNSNHGNHGNSSGGGGSKPHHRKPGPPFKREGHGSSDKLIKQNDLIISLLKEIRDRLPAPPNAPKPLDIDQSALIDDVDAANSTAGYDMPDEATDDIDTEEEYASSDPEQDEMDQVRPVVEDDEDLDSKVNGNY